VYRTGHYGAALLVYAPVGAVVFLAAPELALLGGAGVLLLATLPDYDLRVPFVSHRGPTHTVLFLLAVAGLLGAAGWVAGARFGLGGRVTLAGFAFLVGALGIGSHLLADVLTPAGIEPFWPVSSRNYTLSLVRASNPVANWALLALGVFVTAGALLVVSRVA
jgi:inner membrane protein